MLLPFSGRSLVHGFGVVCWGSAARLLALLATSMGRLEEAESHFEAAMRWNERIGARPWLARTQAEYAAMLLDRGRPGDREKAIALVTTAIATAQGIGQTTVVEHCLALKLQAQGVGTHDLTASLDAVRALVEKERPDLRGHASPDGTVTILFTDIEGSTAMTERLGDRRAQEILRAHNALVRRELAAHGGFEVKSQGDGFMIAFQSARRALRCAIALQGAFAAHAEQHPGEPIRVRIGLHTGEPIKERDDFFGQAVIMAARIAAAAKGGEILVSSLLRELTQVSGEFKFASTRQIELKGLDGLREVSAVAW
jgi:class 3 adenylate cyclase